MEKIRITMDIIVISILVTVGLFTLIKWSIEIVRDLFRPKLKHYSRKEYIKDKIKKEYTL